MATVDLVMDSGHDEMVASMTAFKVLFAEQFLDELRARTPVRTGVLQASWDYEIDPDGDLNIGTDVDYAPYVEFGTPKMKPVGMLGATVQDAENIITQILMAP